MVSPALTGLTFKNPPKTLVLRALQWLKCDRAFWRFSLYGLHHCVWR